jgi:hypothetical protein
MKTSRRYSFRPFRLTSVYSLIFFFEGLDDAYLNIIVSKFILTFILTFTRVHYHLTVILSLKMSENIFFYCFFYCERGGMVATRISH